MGTKEKLIERFKTLPQDFEWQELIRMLTLLGYTQSNKGATSGSRTVFKQEGKGPIMLHRPHPGNVVKRYMLRQIYEELISNGSI